MRPEPAPTRPGPWPPREGEGTAGNAAPGERGAGRGARPAPPPPRPAPIGRASRPSRSAAPMRAAGRGGPRRVCLRNAESHVVLLFLVQSLGARCVTHCAAGTATSPGRRWQHQQQQPRRRRRGPRVPGHTPAPRSAARRQDPCGRARLRLGPEARGPPTLGPAREPQAPPESPGGSGRCRRRRPRRASSGAPERGGRCATARCRPPALHPAGLPEPSPPPGPEGRGLRRASRGGGSRPRPLRSPRPLHAGPGGAA